MADVARLTITNLPPPRAREVLARGLARLYGGDWRNRLREADELHAWLTAEYHHATETSPAGNEQPDQL